jgi:hypothetical protein
MDEATVEITIAELLRLPEEIAQHRAAISEIAARRRELARQLNEEIGPTKAAKRLGISRQVFWQILNPERSQGIKRRSARSRSGESSA